MNISKIIELILLMALVTYIPRALPVILMKYVKINSKAEHFMKMVPYTAMAALIVPGVLSVNPNHSYVGITCGLTAAFLSFRKFNITVVIIAAVILNFILI